MAAWLSEVRIPYKSEEFPPCYAVPGTGELRTSWGRLIKAALTIGRPNIYEVFRHADASRHEARFRYSLLRMAIEQIGTDRRLYRTAALRNLDPTEKGMVSYFLGMTLVSVFANKFLETPFLTHVDVYRNQLPAFALEGRSRPDLVGWNPVRSKWSVFESKGRSSPANDAVMTAAKDQAFKIRTMGGEPCSLHVGSIAYFASDQLKFWWRDPEPPADSDFISIPEPDTAWSEHYRPIAALLDEFGADAGGDQVLRVKVPDADFTIELAPEIANFIANNEWFDFREFAQKHAAKFKENGFDLDGVRVIAGENWALPAWNVLDHSG